MGIFLLDIFFLLVYKTFKDISKLKMKQFLYDIANVSGIIAVAKLSQTLCDISKFIIN